MALELNQVAGRVGLDHLNIAAILNPGPNHPSALLSRDMRTQYLSNAISGHSRSSRDILGSVFLANDSD